MADFNITDRFQDSIATIQEGQGLEAFPLLDKVAKRNVNVLQYFHEVGFEEALYGEQQNKIITEGNIKLETLGEGFNYSLTIDNAGKANQDIYLQAIEHVRKVILQTIEAHLIWGGVAGGALEESPIHGAMNKASEEQYFSQSFNDVMLVADNDFTPVQAGVIKAQTLSYTHYKPKDNTDKGVIINPNKAILIGEVEPRIVVTQDLRKNKVKIYGTSTVTGGFYGFGAVKVIKGGN